MNNAIKITHRNLVSIECIPFHRWISRHFYKMALSIGNSFCFYYLMENKIGIYRDSQFHLDKEYNWKITDTAAHFTI